jgi:DNA mismatch endonuclease (patch repair protein)
VADIWSRERRSEVMALIRSTGAKSTEGALAAALDAMGYSGQYERNAGDALGSPDFMFRDASRVIFANGCLWHDHECRSGRRRPGAGTDREAYWEAKLRRNVQRDGEVRRAYLRAGWGLMVVWECELRKRRLEDTCARVDAFLRGAADGD